MILNLDKCFNPMPDAVEIAFEAFTFSGGEPHIRIADTERLASAEKVFVSHRLRSFDDFGLLLLAIDALKRMLTNPKIVVLIPYFPAARQDRVMVKGEALSVKVYADILNASGISEVVVFDAHSEVTAAVLDNCLVENNHKFIKEVTHALPSDLVLASPDGGALKKIYKLAAALKKFPVVECGKTRDVATGKLSGFKVYQKDLERKPVLVVDDICDGGGTFIGLAEELKRKNAGPLYLAVSHGIFGKGLELLLEHYDHIFTTDSVKNIESTKTFTQIKLATLQGGRQ